MKRQREEEETESRDRGDCHQQQVAARLQRDMYHIYMHNCITYIHMVKNKFENQEHKFDLFADVLIKGPEALGLVEMMVQAMAVLRDHIDLVLGFGLFLPIYWAIALDSFTSNQSKEFWRVINFLRKFQARFYEDHLMQKGLLDTLNAPSHIREQQVMDLFKDHSDLLEDFNEILRAIRCPPNQHERSEQNTVVSQNAAKDTLKMELQRSRQDLIGGIPELCNDKQISKINMDNHSLPKQSQDAREASKERADKRCGSLETKLPTFLRNGLAFFSEVRGRLKSDEAMREIMGCLYLYSEGVITQEQFLELVKELSQDAMLAEKISAFLIECEQKERDLARYAKERKSSGPLPKLPNERVSSKARGTNKCGQRDDVGRETSRLLTKGGRSSSDERVGSYRLLSGDHPRFRPSGHKSLFNVVLNDTCVLVTSGSKDLSFKHACKNSHEEAMFRCEDDMFELDMMLHYVRSTIECLDKLLEKTQRRETGDCAICLNEHLTGVHFRCIELMYVEHALDFINLLGSNPGRALPVVLQRLRQKEEEWSNIREKLSLVWKEVYAKNFYKSLCCHSTRKENEKRENLTKDWTTKQRMAPLFLKRCKLRYANEGFAWKNTHFTNGLKLKFFQDSFKYVPGTKDFFYRRRRIDCHCTS